MPKKNFYFEIFAVSLASILLEISYTRIFSFKVWYYFTYLIIGVALLGLGAGGVLVATSRHLRESDPETYIHKICMANAVCVIAGYFINACLQLNFFLFSQPIEMLKLIIVSLTLMLPFLLTGITVSKILSFSPESAGRLYGADLLGASLGCITCIPLLVMLDPPRTVILASLIFSIAALRLSFQSRRLLLANAAFLLLLIAPLAKGSLLPDPKVDIGKTFSKIKSQDVRYSKWNPVFRVDVVGDQSKDIVLILQHDGQAGSGLWRYRGNLDALTAFDSDPRALPFQVLPKNPKVLIIGVAGGREILDSLYHGAEHVTGVELNPVTVSLLLERFSDYTGDLTENPRVDLVNGEGRWFMKQTDQKFDLIWFVAPDSYAAMNASSAGGFVLAESYLYTVEMLQESLKRLSENGIICAQFGEFNYNNKPNRTARFVATAREAFSRDDLPHFEQRLAIFSSIGSEKIPLSTVILSKDPLSFEQIGCLRSKIQQLKHGKVRFVPGESDGSPVCQLITLPQSLLKEWFNSYPYILTPVVDNSPYFWHFTRYSDAIGSPFDLGGKNHVDREDSVAERVAIILVALVAVFAALFLLLPFVAIGDVWVQIPYKLRTGVYFGSLGLGFMFLEVVLIQMLTLFLGYPTRSLSVTLFALLLFSGLGSLLSERYAARRNIALLALLTVLFALVIFYQVGLPLVIDHYIGKSLAARIALTVAMIAPLGLCLGAFMPIGLTTAAAQTSHKREYVAWGWAVNGFFSVMSSILCTILSMIIGFKLVMWVAVAVYALGIFSLQRVPLRRSED